MSSRGAGAALALIAAAFLAVSVATPVMLPGELSLFAGHPTIDGHTQRLKDVYVGLLDAELCNTGGDGKCNPGIQKEKLGFRLAAYGELGATALLVLSALALAALTLKKSERRKSAAKLVQLASVLAIIGAGAMLVQGPFVEAVIPIGIGMPLYATGVLGALIASLIAVRPPPPLKLRVADRDSQPLPALGRSQQPEPARTQPQAFDVQALFAEEQRASDRSRDARASRDVRRPAADADDPANSSDPFAPSEPSDTDRSLFTSQLRPLYEATPQQGGTAGLLPIERPALPFAPPVARGAHNPGFVPPPVRGEFEAHRTVPPPPGAVATMNPPSSPPLVMLPANAPTIFATPIDPALAGLAHSPIQPAIQAGPDTTVGPPMISVPVPPTTQISLVPPMPDHDLPIGPPTAVIGPDGSPPPRASGAGPMLFPRPDTPLAPPPPPVESARPRRESRPPPPPRHKRESQAPPRAQLNGPPSSGDSQPLSQPPFEDGARTAHAEPPPVARDTASPPLREVQPARAMRASVPMPARPGRPGPSQPPPPPSSGAPRIPPPRSTLPMAVPPPPGGPAIPVIPPIPPIPIPAIPPIPRRVGPTVPPDVDQATISRVPIEITENASPTSVSVPPGGDELTDADDTNAERDRGGNASTGWGAAGPNPPAHLRATMPFTVPDTPSEPVDSLDSRANPTDPEGDPLTIPARFSDRFSPVHAASAVRERPVPRVPLSTAPDSLPPPKDNKQQMSGPSPACPQCESPMAWVEEHLRFYCKSCRMYF